MNFSIAAPDVLYLAELLETNNYSIRILPVVPGTSTPPQARAGLIEWEGAGYWQVQTIELFDSVCKGSDITCCEVAAGEYNVINLTTGQRFENVMVWR